MEGVEDNACVGILVAVIAGVADPPVIGTPALEVGVDLGALEKLQACKAINNTEASENFKIVFSMLLFIKVLL